MSGLLLLSIACGPQLVEGPKDTQEEASDEVSIALVSPADGDGTYTGTMDLSWAVTGLTLDPMGLGAEPREGHGHVHVYVDGELFEESADEDAQVTGLTEGTHTILVRLAGNDHAELEAQDSAEVQVTMPAVRLVSPPDGSSIAASSTPLAIAVEGFQMTDALGAEPSFGEGYFKVSVDGEVRDWGVDPALAVATGLTEGSHIVRVELVENDGSSLEPPVFAESRVEVLPGSKGVFFDRAAFGGPFDSATLPLALSTSAFTLVDSDGTVPPVEGEGHMHLYMDGAWLDRTVALSHVLQNVPPGLHTFEARLVSNDGFELPVIDRLHVNVAPDRPDALITYPGDDWVMDTGFDLQFETENFTLDAASMGGPNAPDVGHAQVYLDGVLLQETGAGLVSVRGLTVGTHTLRVQLANNDRTPLSPPVYNEIEVVVEPTTP